MWKITGQPSEAARTSLIYITAGSMAVIWVGVWFAYLLNNPPESNALYYWAGGLMISGLALIAIGLGVGQIGQSARKAEGVATHIDPVAPVAPAATPVVVVPPTAPPASRPEVAGSVNAGPSRMVPSSTTGPVLTR